MGDTLSAPRSSVACSQVATVHRLLRETLAIVGQDVLQLARVSNEKLIRPTFPSSSLSS
jgi:hypothetical protein